MDKDKRCCGTCNWCKRKRDGTLICIFVDSTEYGSPVVADHGCDQWEDKCQQ